jgi:hypothetical protein
MFPGKKDKKERKLLERFKASPKGAESFKRLMRCYRCSA